MAVLDKQLGGAGVGDDLLYLTEVDKKGSMAADDHRIILQRFLRLLHSGAKHIGLHLSIAQMAHFHVVANSLNI